jgi:hypothetical protein
MKDIFVITVEEIQHLTNEKFGRYLNNEELKQVQKRIQFGLECWEEVTIYAINDIISKNEK